MIRSLRFSPLFLLLFLWFTGPQAARAQSNCPFVWDPLTPPFACLGGDYQVSFSAPCLSGPYRVEISQCAPPFYNFTPPDTSYIIQGSPATIRIPRDRDTSCIRGIRIVHIATGAASNVKTIQFLTVDRSPKPRSVISIISPIKDVYCPTDSILFGIDSLLLNSFNPPPTFQWLLNGTPVPGAVRSTFVYNTWKPGDCVRLLVTKGNKCAQNDTGSSAPVCLNVKRKPSATLVIAAGGTGCSDDTSLFRLDTANIGPNPRFQWFMNGVPIAGATSISYLYPANANCRDKIMGRVYVQDCPDSATGGPVELKSCGKVRVDNVVPPTSCAGDSLHVDYSTIACFNPDNVFTFELSDENGSFANPIVLGSLADTNGGRFNGVSPEDLRGGFNYRIRIRSSSPVGISNISDTIEIYNRPGSPFPQNAQRCGPGRVTLRVNVVGAQSYAWYTTQRGFGDVRVRYPGPGGAPGQGALVTTDTFSIYLTKDTAFYVVAISPFGCESRLRSTVRATINPPLVVSAGPDQQACEGGSCVPLTGASPTPGVWSGTGVVNGTFCPGTLPAGTYPVQFKYVSSEGCSDSATKNVVIQAVPAPDAGTPDSTVCVPGPPFRFSLHGATPPGGIWSGSPALVDNQGTYNPSLMPVGRPDTIYYTIVQAGCSRSDFRVLRPQPVPDFNVNVTNASACLVADGSATITPFDSTNQTAVFTSLSTGNVVPQGPAGTVRDLAPGRYSVLVSTNGIACSTEATFIVDDPDGPTPQIQNLASAYCSNDLAVILTSDIPGGRWLSDPANLVNTLTGEFNPSNAPSGPVTIYYTYRDAGTGCLGADTAQTVINSAPSVPAERDTTICQNSSAIALTSGGIWSGPGVVQVGTDYVFDPAGPGAGLVNILTHTVTANNCSTTVNRTIFVNPIPVISLSPTGVNTICAGSCATVTATLSVTVPGAFYTLFNTATGNAVGSNATGIFEVCQAGTYRVFVATGPCGDTSSASVTINILTLPTVTAGSDTIICRNAGLLTLTGTPAGAPFTTRWTGQNVVTTDNVTYFFDPSTASSTTPTRVTYVVQSGTCADSASKLIAVTDPLVASLAASQAATCNEPINLIASPSGGNFLYFFYRNDTLITSAGGIASPLITVRRSGAYKVSVIPQSSGGQPACGDTSAAVNITIDSLPPTADLVTLVNITACGQDASIPLAVAPSPYTTVWTGNGVVSAGPNVYFFNPSLAGAGVQTLVITIGNGSCSRRDSIRAGVGSTPKFTLKYSDATTCISGDGSATIVYGTPGSNLTVTWFPPSGTITNTADSSRISGLQPGLYSATIANPITLCDTTISFRIGNPTTFRARITGVDSAYCINSSPIIATGSPSGTRPSPFTLSTPDARRFNNPAVIDPSSLTPGLYTLTYEQDSAGCLAVDSVRFRIRPLPVADIVNDTITVCDGQSGTFTAATVQGATRYVWRFGADSVGTGTSFTAGAPGSYSLTVFTSLCSSTTVFGLLRTLPAPNAGISVVGNDTACIGSSITLSATGSGTSYQWFRGPILLAGETNPTLTVNIPGNYTVAISNGICADTSDSQILTFQPRPAALVTASGPLTFCEGGSVTLTAGPNTGNVRYVWRSCAGDSIASGVSLTVTDSRSVQLQVIDLTTGCDSTSTCITTSTQPRPLDGIQILGDTSFCTGGFVDIAAVEPAGTYLWEGPSPVGGATTRSVRITASGNYRVIVNPGGCADTSRFVQVQVDTIPTARILNATSPLTLCQGSTYILQAQQGTGNSYQWQIGGVDQTGATQPSFTIPTNVPNSFTITVVVRSGASTNGCSQTSQPLNVVVNPTPQASIFALTDTTVCPGTNVILGGNNVPGTTPIWVRNGTENVSPTPPSNFLTINQGGDYSYVLTQGGCSDTTRSIKVRVVNLPTPFAGDDRSVCVTDAPFSLTGYTPALGPNTSFSGPGMNRPGTDVFDPSVAGIGQKQIIYTYADSGCSVRDTVVLTVVPSFSVSIDPVTVTICAQSSTTLTPTISPRLPGVTYTYQWRRNGGDIPGATDSTFIAADSGTYTVVVSGGTCGVTSLPARVNFFQFTAVDAGPDVTLCRSQGTFTLTATPNVGTWQGTDVDPVTGVINLATATGGPRLVYYITNQGNCVIRDSVLVTVNDNPTAEVKFTNVATGVEGQAIDIGDEVRLTASPGGSSYTWSPPVTASSNINEGTASPAVTTTYTVTVANLAGCTATGSVTVTVRTDVRVANAFSPNSDGQNDTWNIYNIQAYPNADIQVFNRWGALVYKAKGSEYVAKPWDGTADGSKLPVGAYYYIVDLNNNTKPFIGDVSLVR